jgi:DNA-binding NarL/FixJ family response regulator
MLRFLITDDHSVVRKGLKQILSEAFPSADILEASCAEDMLKLMVKEKLDVVISDISMPGMSGLEVLEKIRLTHPKLPVLILSSYSEDQYALRVLKAGASGYLNKVSAAEELINAIHTVLLGKRYITPSIAEKLVNTLDKDKGKSSHENLSNREFEVLKLLVSGKPVVEIAKLLSLSVTTVSTYRARILKKMNLKTNAGLTIYAVENNLV